MPPKASILVVEDDPVTRSLIVEYFEKDGFHIRECPDGNSMQKLLSRKPFDLILLDVNLPDTDGLSLTRELRRQSDMGIIIVTNRRDEVDRIVGMELGADDYITKPFNFRELLARANSVLRRVKSNPVHHDLSAVVEFEGWRFDLSRRCLMSPESEEIHLTTGEFEILTTLIKHAGRVVNRDSLLSCVSQRDWDPTVRSVDILIGRLRKKLNDDPRKPRFIITVRGLGYAFAAKSEQPFH